MWIESVVRHSFLACDLLWLCSLIEISDTELSGIHWSRKVSYLKSRVSQWSGEKLTRWDTMRRARGRHCLIKLNASNSWELRENENSWKFQGKFSGKMPAGKFRQTLLLVLVNNVWKFEQLHGKGHLLVTVDGLEDSWKERCPSNLKHVAPVKGVYVHAWNIILRSCLNSRLAILN